MPLKLRRKISLVRELLKLMEISDIHVLRSCQRGLRLVCDVRTWCSRKGCAEKVVHATKILYVASSVPSNYLNYLRKTDKLYPHIYWSRVIGVCIGVKTNPSRTDRKTFFVKKLKNYVILRSRSSMFNENEGKLDRKSI